MVSPPGIAWSSKRWSPSLKSKRGSKKEHEITVYQGGKGIKAIFDDILREGKDAVVFGAQGNFATHQPAFYAQFTRERVRKGLKLTQQQFAQEFGLELRTVQDWEQGRVLPTGAARTLLRIIERDSDAVRRALA